MYVLLAGAVIGLLGGVLSGVLGVGGGVLFVPALVLLLGLPQLQAHGVSLAVVAVTAAAGGWTHYRQGHIELRVAASIAPAAVLSALVGSTLAGMLSADALQRVFALVLLGVGVQTILITPGQDGP